MRAKKTTLFRAYKIGAYARTGDEISEDDGRKQMEKIAENLQWMKETIPERLKAKDEPDQVRRFIEGGLELEFADEIAAFKILKKSSQKTTFISGAVDVIKTVGYGIRDIWGGRRVKTAATVLTGIAIGITVGILIGTLLFPGVGTAVGAAVGGALSAATFTTIGGTIGATILGALAGSWLGKKIASKVFKTEKRFELSKEITDKLEKNFGIDSETARLMNGYLYNRAKAVKSDLSKKSYKILRTLGIYEGNPIAIEKAARFFCHELLALEKETKDDELNPALEQEIDAVLYILQKLKKASGLSLEARLEIDDALKDFDNRQAARALSKIDTKDVNQVNELQELLALKNKKLLFKREPGTDTGVKTEAKIAYSPEVSEKIRAQFSDEIRKMPEIKTMKMSQDSDLEGACTLRYNLTTDKGALPEITVTQSKMVLDKTQLNSQNTDLSLQVLVLQAKAYCANTGSTEVTVFAAKDNALAIKLMAASINAGLHARLDETEYPDAALVKEIETKAKLLAESLPPQPPLRPRPA